MEVSLDRILGIIGAVAIPLGIGVGIAMDTKTLGELRFSQGCFIVSAVIIAIFVSIWGFTSDATGIRRIFIVSLLFALAGVGLVESLRWSQQRHDSRSDAIEGTKHPDSEEHRTGTIAQPGTNVSPPDIPPATEPAKLGNRVPKVAVAAPHLEPSVSVSAYLQPDGSYLEGTLLAGIPWKKLYVDVRLDIANGPIAIKNLDFLVSLDTSIAGVGQISQFPGITAFPPDMPVGWLEATNSDGSPSSIPASPVPGAQGIAPTYRVQCSEIFANTTVHLTVASIALNSPKNGELPEQLFAERRPPRAIEIKGTYETENGGSVESHSVEFSRELKQP